MGTKLNPGKFDCYANAEPDEPMFVLLARDKHAPTLVWLWATLRELDGEDPAKVHEARDCVASMLTWQKDHGRAAAGLGVPPAGDMTRFQPLRGIARFYYSAAPSGVAQGFGLRKLSRFRV